jgi:hypothetical protein
MFLAAAALASTSCRNNVRQDLATGDDGRVKEAKAIELEDNEARIHGIVTYPGGDRVDWRRLELPKDKDGTPKLGTLSLTLTWTPPRPGLAVGMDVFDQYGRQVASQRGRQASARYRRQTDIANATGVYLIRVYAPFRGDAGKYRLKLSFAEATGPGGEAGFPPPGTSIPDPPRLAAVPEPVAPTPPVVCDLTNWRTTKGCENFCPNVPDVEMPGCQKIMPCDPWDKRIRKCRNVKGPVCPTGTISTTCEPEVVGPEEGTVANIQQSGSKVSVTFSVRRGHRIEKGWKGHLELNKKRVPNSDFVVTKTAERQVWGNIDLTSDKVDGKRAVISPP